MGVAHRPREPSTQRVAAAAAATAPHTERRRSQGRCGGERRVRARGGRTTELGVNTTNVQGGAPPRVKMTFNVINVKR